MAVPIHWYGHTERENDQLHHAVLYTMRVFPYIFSFLLRFQLLIETIIKRKIQQISNCYEYMYEKSDIFYGFL